LSGEIAVDTNVFTAQLRRDSDLSRLYARHVVGHLVAVAPQTVAEARYGALKSAWGSRRASELAQIVERVTVLAVHDVLIEEVAQLRNRCRKTGHALHQDTHNADLWIAAAAIRWGLPLAAHDAVFIGCPGLDLRTEITH
jgi:predicted nucleic acid-binding protein